MFEKVIEYFNTVILAMIKERYPNIYPDMSIMILGSVGLGIDDENSDLEAVIYLEDKCWKEHGRQIQLSLNHLLSETNQWRDKGSIICVHPIEWLLDGNAQTVFENKDKIPWENISMESLYTMQHNLILFDPKGMLSFLRNNTLEEYYPISLWKKALIINLKQLIYEDFFEYKKCVNRNQIIEVNIIWGRILEDIYHIAFFLSQQYYPWRTHITWAYDQLNITKSELGQYINLLSHTTDWNSKTIIINNMIDCMKDYIIKNDILPEIDLSSEDLENELIWAERLSAWNNPNWKEFVQQKKDIALQNGHLEEDFWVWSLWG